MSIFRKLREHKMQGIYKITLRASDGQEKTELAWFPTETTKQYYCDRANKYGMQITIKEV